MKMTPKVLWAEGMLLGQQHFQQWDAYHHARQNFLASLSTPFLWGVKKLLVDEDALTSGQLIIKQCQAIFKNGLIVDFDDRFSPALHLSLLDNQSPSIEIFLAIPINTNVKGISGYKETDNPAFIAQYNTFSDDYDPAREREVLVSRPNLKLLQSGCAFSGFQTLKILEIEKRHECHFQEIYNFVPAIFSLEASPWLMDLIRSHYELLLSKSRLLRVRCRDFGMDVVQFKHRDIPDFLLLNLFDSVIPAYRLMLTCHAFHPIQYYQLLIQLLGSLSTFRLEDNEALSIDYQNEDLRFTFTRLDALFRDWMESVIPSRMATLKLRRENETLYVVDHIDSTIFTKHSFYLAVLFESNSLDWLSKFTRQVKITSHSMIETIVVNALPGVSLTHVQRPPNQLPVKSGYEYFYLEPNGACWESIFREQSLALFSSLDFSKALIELITIEESV